MNGKLIASLRSLRCQQLALVLRQWSRDEQAPSRQAKRRARWTLAIACSLLLGLAAVERFGNAVSGAVATHAQGAVQLIADELLGSGVTFSDPARLARWIGAAVVVLVALAALLAAIVVGWICTRFIRRNEQPPKFVTDYLYNAVALPTLVNHLSASYRAGLDPASVLPPVWSDSAIRAYLAAAHPFTPASSWLSTPPQMDVIAASLVRPDGFHPRRSPSPGQPARMLIYVLCASVFGYQLQRPLATIASAPPINQNRKRGDDTKTDEVKQHQRVANLDSAANDPERRGPSSRSAPAVHVQDNWNDQRLNEELGFLNEPIATQTEAIHETASAGSASEELTDDERRRLALLEKLRFGSASADDRRTALSEIAQMRKEAAQANQRAEELTKESEEAANAAAVAQAEAERNEEEARQAREQQRYEEARTKEEEARKKREEARKKEQEAREKKAEAEREKRKAFQLSLKMAALAVALTISPTLGLTLFAASLFGGGDGGPGGPEDSSSDGIAAQNPSDGHAQPGAEARQRTESQPGDQPLSGGEDGPSGKYSYNTGTGEISYTDPSTGKRHVIAKAKPGLNTANVDLVSAGDVNNPYATLRIDGELRQFKNDANVDGQKIGVGGPGASNAVQKTKEQRVAEIIGSGQGHEIGTYDVPTNTKTTFVIVTAPQPMLAWFSAGDANTLVRRLPLHDNRYNDALKGLAERSHASGYEPILEFIAAQPLPGSSDELPAAIPLLKTNASDDYRAIVVVAADAKKGPFKFYLVRSKAAEKGKLRAVVSATSRDTFYVHGALAGIGVELLMGAKSNGPLENRSIPERDLFDSDQKGKDWIIRAAGVEGNRAISVVLADNDGTPTKLKYLFCPTSDDVPVWLSTDFSKIAARYKGRREINPSLYAQMPADWDVVVAEGLEGAFDRWCRPLNRILVERQNGRWYPAWRGAGNAGEITFLFGD